MGETITARALGRKYGMKGKSLRTLRLRLQRLGFLGRAERGKQTYPLLREGLPGTGTAVRREYESKFHRHTIACFVEDACAEIEALAEEMQEWQSGLEGTGLEYTSTYDEVVECVGALEYIDLDQFRDVPEQVAGEDIVAAPPYDVHLLAGWGKRLGRGRRLANALAGPSAAAGHVLSMLEEGLMSVDVREWVDEVQRAVEELDQISFPSR